ncbi:MAG: deoxyhypusine synthase family protein [Candidatus Eisenbacteria bacterium]
MEPKNPALSRLVRASFEPEEAERILSGFLAFTAEAMDANTTVGLSLAGPFAATGHRLDGLAPLLEGGFVDWVVARGEDLYLDAETGFEQAMRNREGGADAIFGPDPGSGSGAGSWPHSLSGTDPGSTSEAAPGTVPPFDRSPAERPPGSDSDGETSGHARPTSSAPHSAAGHPLAGHTGPGHPSAGTSSPHIRPAHTHPAHTEPAHTDATHADDSHTRNTPHPGERLRIGDQIFHRNHVLSTEEFLGRLVVTPPFQKTLATTELNHLLGRFLGERDRVFGITTPTSVLAVAHKYKVPVFSDTPGGSVVGRRIAAAALSGNRLALDLSRDVNLAAAIILRADIGGRAVAVSIGGESPRDLLVQASLHLERPLGLGTCFYSAFLEVAKPGRPRLASRFRRHWGDSAPRLGVVELASDLALPLLSAIWLQEGPVKEGRQLYASRDALLEELRDLYLRRDLERQVRETQAQIQSQIQSKIEETQATLQAEVTKVQTQLQQRVQRLLDQVRVPRDRKDDRS